MAIVLCRRLGNELFIGARESKSSKCSQRRTRVGRKDGLADTQVGDVRHLPQTLERGLARIGAASGMLLRGQVARGEPRVIVRWPDQSIEVELPRWHITLL